jgi:hypothetical protein
MTAGRPSGIAATPNATAVKIIIIIKGQKMY